MKFLRPPHAFRLSTSARREPLGRTTFCLLLSAVCIFPTAVRADATPPVSLIYQWDFNADSTVAAGTTVTPSVSPTPNTGVLTMSQIHLDPDTGNQTPPVATPLYSAAGAGVFYNATTNPNDRAFNNAGTIYDLQNNGDPDLSDHAGMVSSNFNATVPSNATLSASAGTHTKITITTWVKLDGGNLYPGALDPRLIALGSQNYDGDVISGSGSGNNTGINGTYLSFYNDGGTHANTLRFTSNGAKGSNNDGGFFGAANIINQFKSDWMFVAVTYDSTLTPVVLGGNPTANVKFYLGDKSDPLSHAVSSGPLPVSSTDLVTAGSGANLNSNFVYIGNRVAGPLNRGLGALVDDVRIYDGTLDQYQLDRVRQNLPIPTPGDFNFDGVVNVADISAMMIALTHLSDFQTDNHMLPSDLLALGDVNNDTVFDNRDIQALISNVAATAPPSAVVSVPEPAAWLLMLAAALALLCVSRRQFAAENLRSKNGVRTIFTEVFSVFGALNPQPQTLLPAPSSFLTEKKPDICLSFPKASVIVCPSAGIKAEINKLIANARGGLKSPSKTRKNENFSVFREVGRKILALTVTD